MRTDWKGALRMALTSFAIISKIHGQGYPINVQFCILTIKTEMICTKYEFILDEVADVSFLQSV